LRHFELKDERFWSFECFESNKNESIGKLVPWKDKLPKHMQVIFDKIFYSSKR
jgi:hypothetical protein